MESLTGVLRPVEWVGGDDGHLEMLDQTLLPGTFKVIACHDLDTVLEAIRSLRVRGAPRAT